MAKSQPRGVGHVIRQDLHKVVMPKRRPNTHWPHFSGMYQAKPDVQSTYYCDGFPKNIRIPRDAIEFEKKLFGQYFVKCVQWCGEKDIFCKINRSGIINYFSQKKRLHPIQDYADFLAFCYTEILIYERLGTWNV